MHVEPWLTRAAREHPDRDALCTPAGTWSYGQLDAAARSGAGELAALGAAGGARVAIALPAGLAFAQALHACMLLGAVAVPIDLRLSGAEQARIALGCDLRVAEQLPQGTVWQPRAVPAHALGETAVVIHTSGTSAAPRPVELTYGNLLWSALGSAVALGLDPAERWLCALPLSHVGGLSILVRSAIYSTCAVVHERFQTEPVLAALREDRITLVSVVATTLARLLDAGLENPPQLRCALTGGGPVAPALIERAAAARVALSLTYGLTESCSQATTTPLAEPLGERHSAGPPLFCTRVRIAGDGEILLRGPTIAPALAGPGGWLATGDLGSLDDDGWLSVRGRKADTIVSGGENVAPAQVEAVLEAHPAVLEAAVIGVPDPVWGEAVSAIVVARPGVQIAEQQLREHCSRALAPFKVPKSFRITAQPLPRTRSGKLLRRELA